MIQKLLTGNSGADFQSAGACALEQQNAHGLSIVLFCRVPDNGEGLAGRQNLALGRAGDGIEVGGLREGSAHEGEKGGGGDGELHFEVGFLFGLWVVGVKEDGVIITIVSINREERERNTIKKRVEYS